LILLLDDYEIAAKKKIFTMKKLLNSHPETLQKT